MDRMYQPAVLWHAFVKFADGSREKPIHPGSVQLLIFRCDQAGAYMLDARGKLYWDEVVGDAFTTKCEQTALWDHRDQLCEVMAKGLFPDGSLWLFATTFAEFMSIIQEKA